MSDVVGVSRLGSQFSSLFSPFAKTRRTLRDLVQRLISIEAKQDGAAGEARVRLANIESLIERLGSDGAGKLRSSDPFASFTGSSDQGFGHITYSQFGEDLVVANIFALLGIKHPTYLDVGANHPLKGSNTALFYARGSRGAVVEANPHLMPLWQDVRPRDLALNVGVSTERGAMPFYFIDDFSGRNTFERDVADAFIQHSPEFKVSKVEMIETVPLNDIVDEHLRGVWPDFLTIDVEGLDLAVLNAADFTGSHPLVICVETKSGAGEDISSAFLALLAEKGFRPAFRTWANLIAVHQDAAARLAA